MLSGAPGKVSSALALCNAPGPTCLPACSCAGCGAVAAV